MSDQLPKILLVEDEVNFGSILSQYLGMHQFDVTWAKNGAEAYSLIKSEKPFDCGILDVMMPEMDGLTLGNEIKQARPNLPFIFLTAKSLKSDFIEGYQCGAVDYITKPFDSEILVLKLKALLQKKPAEASVLAEYFIGDFILNPTLRLLQYRGQELRLSPKESGILELLAMRKNQLVNRETIMQQVWKDDNYFSRRSMDVYMAKLRKYLAQDPKVQITSLHAGGYILEVSV